ncbi:hypothetical protein K0P33_18980 [Pseudomonas sp. ArH3a]|uniref:RHS repeat-associated core domain-containing protein n=1 Tax=Pseudomonas sp. ArH3a TaxID=2862945 RepID=UPI001F592348|nr:RHS repeat-associated core domain-containing protein [Pseudomonas sp. ArH3a]UNM17645.1 hypothetical protein K0P33_18980 [Pseudomonas sp. ArH3a]
MAHNPMGTDPSDYENDPIFNATTQKRNVVDPRTGLFENYVKTESLIGNCGLGPTFDMSLYYTPVVNNESALGDGWFYGVTTYSETYKKLTLHSGEVLEIEKNKDLTTLAVIAKWADGKLTVQHKGGRKEVLVLLEGTGTYVTESLTTDDLNKLLFEWMTTAHVIEGKTYYQIQLTGIKDATRNLLKVDYTPDAPDASPALETVKFIFWPDDAAQTLTYTLAIKDYALQSVSLGDNIQSTFEYLDHPVCGWLLTTLTNFDGLEEKVVYKDNGLAFPDNPKLSALPCVSTHTLTPNGGGTPVTTTYVYERQDEKKYRTIMSEGTPAIRTTVYQYDEKHEVTSQTLTQGTAKTQTDYAMENSSFIVSRLTSMTYTQANKSYKKTNGNLFNTNSALRLNNQNNVTTEMDYIRGRNESPGEIKARTLLGAIKAASKQPSKSTPDTSWGPDGNNLNARFESTYVDTEFVDTPGLLSLIPGLLPSLLPGLLNVAQFKLHGYKVLPELSEAKLTNTLQGSLATDKFADAALIGQRFEYFESNDFRKGRKKSISQSTLDNRSLAPIVTDPVRSFDYTLGGVGDTELTTTTTETDDQGNQRTASETQNTLNGRLIRQVDADGNRTEYAYNPYGQLATLTVCAQSPTYRQITTYTYPAPGQVQITEPNGQTRLSQYDGQDQLVSEYLIEDGQRKQTKAVKYDAIGREVQTTRFDYKENGSLLSETQELRYDEWNQVCARKYNDSREDFDFYDPIALTRTQWTGKATDKHATVTSYDTDQTIKKIEWKGQDGNVYQTQTATYTRAKQVKQLHTKGELGVTTIDYTYDGSGRLLSESHSEKDNGLLAPALVYTYYYTYPQHWLLREAEQVAIEFGGKRQTLGKRTFDSWGRVTSITRGTCTETYTYAGASLVPVSTVTAEGSVLQHDYIKELGNRLAKTQTATTGEQKTFSYAFGAQGLATASEGEHMLRYTHDRNLRVTQQSVQTQPGQAKEVLSNYSLGGRLFDTTDALGEKSLFLYDGKGRRVQSNTLYFSGSHTYNDQGLLLRDSIYGAPNSGISFGVDYTYDSQQRETSRQFTLSGKIDLTLERTYYADDKLKSVQLKQGNTVLGSRSLAYTPGGRLKTCTTTGVWRPKTPKNKDIDQQAFTYDALGNVITCITTFGGGKNTATHTYDSVNGFRLTKVANTHADYPAAGSLSYDAAGRVTQDQTGKKYTYDWLGRLIQAGGTRYSYDPSDRLMTREQDGDKTQIIYDGLNVSGEYSLENNDTYRNLNPGSAGCTVQQIKRSGVKRTLFELRDANGTVCVSYDLLAQTFKHHAYTAYGEHFSDESDSLLGFNGEYCDPITGQSPLGTGYRWYDARCMRFHALDSFSPFGQGGPNMYAYCANGDPVNYQDPSGHASVDAGLRKIWGDDLPGPLSLGKDTQLIHTFLWAGVGILTAVMTGGTSIFLSAALVGAAMISAATGIASVLIGDSDSKASETLAWISLGFGAAGGGLSIVGKTARLAAYLGRSGVAVARNLFGKAAPATTSLFRPTELLRKLFPRLLPRKAEPLILNGNSLLETPRATNLFNVGDFNTVAFITAGVLSGTEVINAAPGSVQFANTAVGDITWLPFGNFTPLWLKIK